MRAATARSGWPLQRLTASSAPPSAAAGRPFSPAGNGATATRPATADCGPILQERPGVRPVAHEHRLAILEREPRLLLLPRRAPTSARTRRRRCASRMKVSARIGGGLVHDDLPASVEDAAAEGAEVLEEHRDEPFVACALPDQAEARRPARGEAGRLVAEPRYRSRRRLEQIRAPVEQSDVDEPRQGEERPAPVRRLPRGRDEIARRRRARVDESILRPRTPRSR